jgi:hypothetical protein
MTLVSKGDRESAMQSIKEQYISVALGLIKELDRCFLMKKLMNAIGITYPQYWMALDMKATFPSHLALMNAILLPSKNKILYLDLWLVPCWI